MGSVATTGTERTARNSELRADLVRLLQLVTDHPDIDGPLEMVTLRFTASSGFIHDTARRLDHRVEARRAGDGWITESVTLDMRRLHVVLYCTRRRPGSVGTDRPEAVKAGDGLAEREQAKDAAAAELDDLRREAARGEL